MNICQNCKDTFEVTEKDREFLTMLKVPEPTFCPPCRMVRRFAFRNERSLYKRKCDLCHKESIMQYPSDAPFPVYCKSCWWSDGWSARDAARDYDFDQSFFSQFQHLFRSVPQPAIIHQGTIVNSDYTNRVTDLKNCYLVFGTTSAENSRYSTWIMGSKECQDSYTTLKSEQCYECIDCTNCYKLFFSRECINCRESWFLYNCQNVTNSFGCVNLRNKQYCIFNEQYTKDEYEKKIAAFDMKSAEEVQVLRQRFEEFRKPFVVPAMTTRRSIESTGNYLEDCKDATNSYNCQNAEHVRHSFSTFAVKDSMDYSYWGATSERIYDAINCGRQLANVHFASNCWDQVIDCEYVMNCHNSKNLFGCVGIRGGQYMIFNKQYDKQTYEQLRAKIIEQMNASPYRDGGGRTYGYGEFFPIETSPHAYNETQAQEFFPLSKEAAAAEKYPWRETAQRSYKITMESEAIPDRIDGVKDAVLQEIIGCEHKGLCADQCTTAFRLIPEELSFYNRAGIPLPRLCSNCRHYRRIKVRNPFKLWPRSCQCEGSPTHVHGQSQCQSQFESSYAPNRPEKVYCIECYQREVA